VLQNEARVMSIMGLAQMLTIAKDLTSPSLRKL
jgi:hypothetical protein